MATVLAIGVPEDSSFRNPDQILYLEPPPLVQSPTDARDGNFYPTREYPARFDPNGSSFTLSD